MESPSEPPLPLAAGRRMLLCSVRHAEAHCIRRRSAIHHHHCHCCRHSSRQTGRTCLHRLWAAAHARAEPPNAPADSVSVRASVALSELGSAEAPAVLHPLRQHLQSAAALRRQFVRSSCGVRRQSARRHHLVGAHSGAHGSLDGPRASAVVCLFAAALARRGEAVGSTSSTVGSAASADQSGRSSLQRDAYCASKRASTHTRLCAERRGCAAAGECAALRVCA
jgi:hypothetical protein